MCAETVFWVVGILLLQNGRKMGSTRDTDVGML